MEHYKKLSVKLQNLKIINQGLNKTQLRSDYLIQVGLKKQFILYKISQNLCGKKRQFSVNPQNSDSYKISQTIKNPSLKLICKYICEYTCDGINYNKDVNAEVHG